MGYSHDVYQIIIEQKFNHNSQNRPKSWAQLLSKKNDGIQTLSKVKHTYGSYQFTHKILWIIIPPNI